MSTIPSVSTPECPPWPSNRKRGNTDATTRYNFSLSRLMVLLTMEHPPTGSLSLLVRRFGLTHYDVWWAASTWSRHVHVLAHVYFSPLSVDSRPMGRPTRSQPTVDRLSADCRLTVGQWVSPTIFQYHLKNETGPRFRGGADSTTGLLTGFGSKPFQMPH